MIATGTLVIDANGLQDALEIAYTLERHAENKGSQLTILDAIPTERDTTGHYLIQFTFHVNATTRQEALGLSADTVSELLNHPRIDRLPSRIIMTFWHDAHEGDHA
jgi:hypothetical protein